MTPAGLAKAEPGGSTRFTPQAAGNVSSLTKFFEQQGQAASEAQPAAAAAGGASPAPHISKRQRLGSVSAHPPLPAEWPTTSPPLAHNGAASASAVTGTPLEGRQLWGDDGSGDAAAREARLASIRAKFGTKRFHPAQELPPAELRALLGAAEADLSPDDCEQRRRWGRERAAAASAAICCHLQRPAPCAPSPLLAPLWSPPAHHLQTSCTAGTRCPWCWEAAPTPTH